MPLAVMSVSAGAGDQVRSDPFGRWPVLEHRGTADARSPKAGIGVAFGMRQGVADRRDCPCYLPSS